MPTTLDRTEELYLRGKLQVCPREMVKDFTGRKAFTQLEWNHILFLHYLWTRDHGGCKCDN